MCVLLGALGCAEGGLPPAPALVSVTPDTTFDSAPTSLVVRGAQLNRRGVLVLTGSARVDDGFSLFVGDQPLEAVRWRDDAHLEAVLPAGTPAGTWDLRLVDPFGRELTLARALTVLRREGARLSGRGALPAAAQRGTTAALVVTVSNQGDTTVEAVELVAGAASGTGGVQLLQVPAPQTLAPGESVTLTLQLRATDPGEVHFATTFEGKDAFSQETRSTGVVESGPMVVFTPPILDATATAQPAELAVGEVLDVITLVTNRGTTEVLDFQPAAAPEGDAGVTGLEVPLPQPLSPGVARTFTTRFTASSPGTARLLVDGRGVASDTGLPVFLDPVATPVVRVLRPPALQASLVVTPLVAPGGSVVQLDVRVDNLGEEDADAVTLSVLPVGSGSVVSASSSSPLRIPASQARTFQLSYLATGLGTLRFQVEAAGLSDRGRLPASAQPLWSDGLFITLAPAPDGGLADAGPPDAGTPERCDNRVDDNGDGLVDCADPTCLTGATCDDGDGCTAGDTCASGLCTPAGSTCTGQLPACLLPAGCDAGVCLATPAPAKQPCPDGRCDGAGQCTPFCDPTRTTLRACYRFEGTLLDASAMANHATVPAPRFDAGVAGLAWFPGATGAVARDHVSLDCTTALTLEAWISPDSFPPPLARAAVLDNDGQYGLFIGPGGELRCSVGLSLNVPLTLTLGTWQHVACIKNGSSLRAYVNGVQVGSTVSAAALTTGTTAGLTLGQNSPSGDVFQGGLDGVRIWCEALPVSELCASPGGCG